MNTRRDFMKHTGMVVLGTAAGVELLSGFTCSTAQTWLTLAEQDLPVLAEQAANIISLAAVTAAVDLIVTTLDIIAANIPKVGLAAKQRLAAKSITSVKIPTAAQLRQQWNKQVCTKAKVCKMM